jgi:hypothetical protein
MLMEWTRECFLRLAAFQIDARHGAMMPRVAPYTSGRHKEDYREEHV